MKPGPGEYNSNVNNLDEKTWKVLNSENLRNYVKITVSHKKLINAGFIRNNKAVYNNSEEERFGKSPNIHQTSRVGPGKYSNVTKDWIKKTYNVKLL